MPTDNSINEQINDQGKRGAINSVAETVIKLGLIWREMPVVALGIDGYIEFVGSNGVATGQLVAVQITSESSTRKESDDGWIVQPDKKHLDAWQKYPLPVLVIIHNSDSKINYWVDARQATLNLNATKYNEAFIPKDKVLQTTPISDFFVGFSGAERTFLALDALLDVLMNNECVNASFPVSYFTLFCAGLTNKGRYLHFDIEVATLVAEQTLAKQASEFGSTIGYLEHYFLFDYIQFLVQQNLAEIDFSDCMVDWYELEEQPSFIARLTSRGLALVKLISQVEAELKSVNKIENNRRLNIADGPILQTLVSERELTRLTLINTVKAEYLNLKD